MEILWKLCVSTNVHNRKLGEISAIYPMKVKFKYFIRVNITHNFFKTVKKNYNHRFANTLVLRLNRGDTNKAGVVEVIQVLRKGGPSL